MAYEGSESARDIFGKFLNQFQPETKTLIRKLERILNKLYRQNLSLLFNETCLNEWLLPTTHTHSHIHIYIYIYIHFGNLPMHARALPAINTGGHCSLTEANIPADSPGNQTETVSLVILSFVYVVLLLFVNIFNTILFLCLFSGP